MKELKQTEHGDLDSSSKFEQKVRDDKRTEQHANLKTAVYDIYILHISATDVGPVLFLRL